MFGAELTSEGLVNCFASLVRTTVVLNFAIGSDTAAVECIYNQTVPQPSSITYYLPPLPSNPPSPYITPPTNTLNPTHQTTTTMSDPYNQYNAYPPNQYGSPAPGQAYPPPQQGYQQPPYQQPGYPPQQQGGAASGYYGSDQQQPPYNQSYGPPAQGGFQHGQNQPYGDPYQQGYVTH